MRIIVSIFFLAMILPVSSFAMVNINTASLDELDTLPNVGPAIAQRIIDARPFSSIEDILRVNGIGTATYDKLKHLITVSGSTTVVVENNQSTTSTGNSSTSSVRTTVPASEPIWNLIVTVPEVAYTGQQIFFDVNPSDGKSRSVRYRWNFGDGNTDFLKKPSHRYTHAGNYVVAVEGYYQREEKLARREIRVLPLALKIDIALPGTVRIKNDGEYEIDLGGMSLVSAGEFKFPRHSILLSGQSLYINVDTAGSVVLKDGGGVVLVNGATAEPLPRPVSYSAVRNVAAVAVAVNEKEVETEVEILSELESGADEVRATSTPTKSKSRIPPNSWTYLALFGLVAIGLFSVYGSRRS